MVRLVKISENGVKIEASAREWQQLKSMLNFAAQNYRKVDLEYEGVEEEAVSKHMQGQEITIDVNLNLADGHHKVWTCDLTHGYIDINADYRS